MTGAPGSDAPTPFHTTPPPDRPYDRRLLVISAHFPPSRAVGGLRWQKMSQFAAERGWGTDVVCLDPSSMPELDRERLADLPPGIRVFGVRHRGLVGRGVLDALSRAKGVLRRRSAARTGGGDSAAAPAPAAAPGSMSRAEAMRFRPWVPGDVVRAVTSYQWIRSELRWADDVFEVARRVVGPEHRVIITSGPPHFAHEAGRRLAALTGLPHVVDFRDPWSVGERVAVGLGSPVYLNLIARYEKRTVAEASLIVGNTELAARAMRQLHPGHADRIVTVMNGSDDETPPAVARDPRFLVAYAGAIYFDRDPRLLFRAAKGVIAELGLRPENFGMEFMGPVDVLSPPVVELARQEGVEAFVRYHPPGSRSASARLLASASLLVSLPQDTETAIPSKIFEYSTYDAWLLNLTKAGSASALVLEDSGADVVDPDDVEGIARVLRTHYLEFAAGTRPRAIGGDGRFSRKRQGALMLDHLERLTKR